MGLLKWLFDLLARLWKLIKKVLPYILLAMAIYLVAVGPIVFAAVGLELTGTAAALGLAGASFLIAPGETAAAVSKAAEGIGDIAATVVTEAGGLLGTAISSVFGGWSWIWLLAAAFVVFFVFSRREQEQNGPDEDVWFEEDTEAVLPRVTGEVNRG